MHPQVMSKYAVAPSNSTLQMVVNNASKMIDVQADLARDLTKHALEMQKCLQLAAMQNIAHVYDQGVSRTNQDTHRNTAEVPSRSGTSSSRSEEVD